MEQLVRNKPIFDQHLAGNFGDNFLLQSVVRVLGFSSQYGGDLPPEPTEDYEPVISSYSVKNMEGEPAVYPSYGDHTQAAVFRTYGGHWQRNSRLNLDDEFAELESDDYVDLYYRHPVSSPIQLEIYETFNTDHVYRISGGLADSTQVGSVDYWTVLWVRKNGGENGSSEISESGSRIFRPKIKGINRQINVIRLEMRTYGSNYYPEIDAVKLGGFIDQIIDEKNDDENVEVMMKGDVETLTNRLSLADLPPELLRYIAVDCVKVDVEKLQIVACLSAVCRKLRNALDDCSLFTRLDLKPIALRQFSRESLEFFAKRSDRLRKLRLSWLPGFRMEPAVFMGNMRHLNVVHLQSCLFVDDDLLEKLCLNSSQIVQLDLSNCRRITPRGFECLVNLKKMRRLSLYRTLIDQFTLRLILCSFRQLEAVNLGSLTLISNMDAICAVLAECCPVTLKAVDFWRAGSTLTKRGVKELATTCQNLEEVDFGWSRLIDGDTLCLLAEMCRKLRRVMLTANRCVRNEDLEVFAKKLPDLEQLDILGSYVVMDAVVNVLTSCHKMNYLDISYCGITIEEMNQLREMFPRVHIPNPSA